MDERVFQITVEFGATFFGTLFGFALAFWHDRRVKHKEDLGIKIRILEAIDLELELNLDSASKVTTLEGDISFLRFHYTKNALDSSIGAGDFSKLDPDIQTAISQVYMIFFEVEDAKKNIFSPYVTESARRARDLQLDIDVLNAGMKGLRSAIPMLRDELQKRIKKLRAHCLKD